MNIRSFLATLFTFILLPFFVENASAQVKSPINKAWRPAEFISIRLQAQGFKVDKITKVEKKGYLVYLQDQQQHKFVYLIDPYNGNVLEKYLYNDTMPK